MAKKVTNISMSIAGGARPLVGQQLTLNFTISPSDATAQTITWSITNESGSPVSHTIENNGKTVKLTPLQAGQVKLYATIENGLIGT